MLQKVRKLLFLREFLVNPTPESVQNIILFGLLCYLGMAAAMFVTLLHYMDGTWTVIGLVGVFASVNWVAWREYRDGSREAARYLFYLSANGFLFLFASYLGHNSGVYLLYFPLICSTFILYSIWEKRKIILMVLLSFACLGMLDLTRHELLLLDLPDAIKRTYYVCSFLLCLAFLAFCVSYLIVIIYKTQAVLRESEAKLSSILESLDEVVWAISVPDQKIIYLNRSAEKVFAFPEPSYYFHKQQWSQVVHPQDRKKYEAFHQQVIKRGTGELEYRLVMTSGDIRWLHDNCKIIRNQANEIVRLEGITTDITERKRNEKLIQQQNEKMRAILESTQSSIFAINNQYSYLSFNSSHGAFMEKAYGNPVIVGMNVAEDRHFGPDTQVMIAHFYRAMQGELFSVVEELGSPERYRTFYETTFNPIQNEQGQVTGVAVFSRDITDRKHKETELLRTNFELDTFVYRSSHDMRAPLRSVLGLVNLIRMEPDRSKHPELLELIERSINKLDSFLSDLISFSRNSRLEISSEPVDFEKLIDECFDNLRYMANADRIRVYKDIHYEKPFFSDNSRIQIILQNLISNAIKYQKLKEEESFIRVRVRTTRKQVILSVEDNGSGIDEAYHGKIFDMFFRATFDAYGSGLGLYITKQVIEKLNGRISLQSCLREGTEFTVTLPNRVPELVEQPAEQA